MLGAGPVFAADPLFLSGREAARLALANSLTLRASAYATLRAAQEKGLAAGAREPSLFLSTSWADSTIPSTSTLTGNEQRIWDMSTGLRQSLVTGTAYELSWNSTRTETDFPFSVLDPNYRVNADLSLTQPLLRGFGIDVNRAPEEAARLTAEVARLEYLRAAEATAVRALDALDEISLARSLLRVREQSVTRALELERAVQAQIRRGVLPEVEALKARVAVARRRDDLLLAKKTVGDTEDLLRELITTDAADLTWAREIIPAPDERTLRGPLDEGSLLADARFRRLDLAAAKAEHGALDERLRIARNELLPSVNLVGGVRLDGLAGEDRVPELGDVSPELAGFLDVLEASAPALAGSIREVAELLFNAQPVDRSLVGGYLEAVENMDFLSWNVGLTLEVPLGNASAEARYFQALFDLKQAESKQRALERGLRIEVREAIRRLETGRERTETAALARRLAEQDLHAEQKKLDHGYSSSQDLLDAQNAVTEARALELEAEVDQRRASTHLAQVEGSLLERLGIEVPPLAPLAPREAPGWLP